MLSTSTPLETPFSKSLVKTLVLKHGFIEVKQDFEDTPCSSFALTEAEESWKPGDMVCPKPARARRRRLGRANSDGEIQYSSTNSLKNEVQDATMKNPPSCTSTTDSMPGSEDDMATTRARESDESSECSDAMHSEVGDLDGPYASCLKYSSENGLVDYSHEMAIDADMATQLLGELTGSSVVTPAEAEAAPADVMVVNTFWAEAVDVVAAAVPEVTPTASQTGRTPLRSSRTPLNARANLFVPGFCMSEGGSQTDPQPLDHFSGQSASQTEWKESSNTPKSQWQTKKPTKKERTDSKTTCASDSDENAITTARPSLASSNSNPKFAPGTEENTTVMLRNCPNDLMRDDLVEILNQKGLNMMYDFVYVPIDFLREASLGYSFVNFVSHELALKAWDLMEGFADWPMKSQKVCAVSWGEPLQGLQAHIERYQNSPVMHNAVPEKFKPIILENGIRKAFPQKTKRTRAPRMKRNRPKEDALTYTEQESGIEAEA